MQTHPLESNWTIGRPPTWAAGAALRVDPLAAGDEAEVLDFLSARPIHTVFIRGFIKENGLVSDLNRGKFYGCRNGEGRLLGIALLGHITLIETPFDTALRAFANFARVGTPIYMILGEQAKVRGFWDAYSAGGGEPWTLVRSGCSSSVWGLLSSAASWSS